MTDQKAAKALREIADFLGHVALNGVDAKDREIALALEQDARAILAAEKGAGAEAGAVEWRIVPTRTGGFWEVRSTLCVMSDEEGDFPLTIADMRTRAEAEAIRDALNRCGVDPRSLLAAEKDERGLTNSATSSTP